MPHSTYLYQKILLSGTDLLDPQRERITTPQGMLRWVIEQSNKTIWEIPHHLTTLLRFITLQPLNLKKTRSPWLKNLARALEIIPVLKQSIFPRERLSGRLRYRTATTLNNGNGITKEESLRFVFSKI